MKDKLSVIILTKNEEDNIIDCLESVSFADEIIIVDDNSTDRTLELARTYTDKFFIHSLNNNFSNQRNFALNHAHNGWVLFIDADERVSEELKKEILNVLKNQIFTGFFVKREDQIWGKKIRYGESGNMSLLRLARKNSGKWRGKVHEKWIVRGETTTLKSPLIHKPHHSVKHFIEDIDNYTELRAIELFENGKSTNWIQIIMFPLSKFILNYFFKKGYKDGVPGFIYAMIMSMHSFLARAKLYQLINK